MSAYNGSESYDTMTFGAAIKGDLFGNPEYFDDGTGLEDNIEEAFTRMSNGLSKDGNKSPGNGDNCVSSSDDRRRCSPDNSVKSAEEQYQSDETYGPVEKGSTAPGKEKIRKHRDRSRSRSKRRSKSHDRTKTKRKSRSPHRSKSHKRKSRDRSRSRHKSKSRRRSTSRNRRSKSRHRSRSPHVKSKRHSRSRHRTKSRSRSKEHKRGRKSRSLSKDRKRSSRKSRSRSKEHKNRKSRSHSRDKRRKRSLTPISLPGRRNPYIPPFSRFKKYSPPYRPPPDDLSPEERDARTIFCMQLSQRIRAKDLEDFFSSVGKVRDVRLITCNKTHRFKGIAYVEFKEPESVALALGLNGQKLLGIPIVVQPTQAEKNRVGNTMPNIIPRGHPGPMRLYVGSLHFNITEDMLRGIFEPFGKIESIQLMTDPDTGRSKGYGFVTYHSSEDAKKALEQMNGFELAGRPMKVNNVTDRQEFIDHGSNLDTDELDRAGIDLGATGRLQLMYKLAEGTGMEIPPVAASALNLAQTGSPLLSQTAAAAGTVAAMPPPIATQCFMLANMFDPTSETNPNWDVEIRDDVIEECNKHGGCVHVFVDKVSPQGNVYVKCPTVEIAVAAVNSLHGRWFGGRIITAAYVPVLNYHNLFPETITANQLLSTFRKV